MSTKDYFKDRSLFNIFQSKFIIRDHKLKDKLIFKI